MTQRKRKSPEKKKARKAPGLLSRGASALMGAVACRPAAAGGIVTFAIVFGFVAANALWYQPGRHPSPFFRTRDADDFTAMAGLRRAAVIDPDPATVTTFRIEREPVQGDDSAAAAAEGVVANTGGPEDAALVKAVQQELSRRKLYQGPVDGVIGRGTTAAIAAFQRAAGVSETGVASPELLATLRGEARTTPGGNGAASTAGDTAAVPLQRPAADLLSSAEDPVAAAIRDAEKRQPSRPAPTPPRPVAAPGALGALGQSAALKTGEPGSVVEAKLVMAIQQGLSNIAYADVSVDGVAGAQTRAAIRHFERHYRLPETGEPNEKVLKKLKDIGAL